MVLNYAQWIQDTPHKSEVEIKVALADFDANVDFLAALVEAANEAQQYYSFQVVYLPHPRAAIHPKYYRSDKKEVGRFQISQVEEYLANAPQGLKVDLVCAFTGCLIENEEYDDLFFTSLQSNRAVSLLSTYGLRDYAKKAKIS